ncbi:MAG: cupin domain-containing protein [Actinobacteria bacterium]|nr:cupin domain-containing protein [Actinomycetota bacterium]
MRVENVAEHPWEEWRPGTQSRMWSSQITGAETLRTGEQFHEPGGGAPRHWHPYEEHLLFLSGKVELFCDGEIEVHEGPCSVIFPPKAIHGFRNVGDEPLHLFAAVGSTIHESYYIEEEGVVTKEYERATGGVRHQQAIDPSE